MRIGVDLGGTKIEAVVMAPDGRIVARERRSTPSGDYGGTLQAVRETIDAAEHDAGLTSKPPVGVAMPGTISRLTGRVKNANSICLNGQAIDRDLAGILGRPVRVANDANCFALSEASDGAGAGHRVVFGVILGTGVGGGIVVDSQVLDGPNGIAGEWGHTPLPWPDPDEVDGPPCYCGRTGCVETWISGPGFSAQYERTSGLSLTAAEIVTQANHSSACAQAAVERLAVQLGKALSTVVNVLDPDIIVLGGGLSNIRALYELTPPALQRYAFSDAVQTPIVAARHGDSSGVRGAAWLWPEA